MSFDAEFAGTVKELGQVHVSDDVLELLRTGAAETPVRSAVTTDGTFEHPSEADRRIGSGEPLPDSVLGRHDRLLAIFRFFQRSKSETTPEQ